MAVTHPLITCFASNRSSKLRPFTVRCSLPLSSDGASIGNPTSPLPHIYLWRLFLCITYSDDGSQSMWISSLGFLYYSHSSLLTSLLLLHVAQYSNCFISHCYLFTNPSLFFCFLSLWNLIFFFSNFFLEIEWFNL